MSIPIHNSRHSGRVVAALMLLGAFAPGGVMAADNTPPAANTYTAAGVNITNQASVDYAVGGINQLDVNSNTDDFEVDRRASVFVTEISNSSTTVTPDQTTFSGANGALGFFVTNTGNDSQDYALAATNRAAATADPHGGASDSIDTEGAFAYYIDVDNDGLFEPGADDGSAVTHLNAVAQNATVRVWVEPADIPAAAANAATAVVTLAVTVHVDDAAGTLGAAAANTAGADTQGTVDTVLADGVGTEGDAASDGVHSDRDSFLVQSAVVTLTKSSVVTQDPINNTTNPKRIPGATVRYQLVVNNAVTASATAEDVIITDLIPTNTTYVTGSIFVSTDTDCGTAGDNTARTDAVDAEAGHDASITGSTLSFGDTGTDIAANTSVTFCYSVTIN